MLKQLTSAFSKAVCILSQRLSIFNTFFQQAVFSFVNYLNQKILGLFSLIKKIFFTSIKLQIKSKSGLSFSFKPIVTFFILILYLFISPHTSANANWEEKVIPAANGKNSIIKSVLVGEKVPDFFAPVHGYISTYFSHFHPGIDIPNPLGSTVAASNDGEVVYASWTNSGHGNLVVLRHNAGFETLYAHLSKIEVVVGQKVTQGQTIGRVGSTGNSTGPHLHFEIHENGVALNPLRFITP